jgi:hypothetical protein
MRILRTIIGIGVLLLTVGAAVGAWAYFEWMAPTVTGTIVDKQQRIIGGRHAAPGRYLSTSFTLKNETEEDRYLYGSPAVVDVQVDPVTYDRYQVGSAVNVRYLPFNPRFARLEGQPVVSQPVWMIVAASIVVLTLLLFKRTRGGVALGALLVAAVVVSTPGPPAAQSILFASLILAVVSTAFAILKRGRPAHVFVLWMVVTAGVLAWSGGARPTTGRTMIAVADVRAVSVFRAPTGMARRNRLTTLQEFDRVHAAFVPEGTTQAVFVLDFVDHASIPNLSEGSRVNVEYRIDDPERARLSQGTKTHYWKNSSIVVGVVLIVAVLTTRKGKPRKADLTVPTARASG